MTVGEEKFNVSNLKSVDPDIFKAIEQEERRQKNKINLIASENFISKAVIEAQGSVLTNKYAEGYPGKRYYGGCEFVDIVEKLAIDKAKKIFKAEHANVQPHSGAIANLAVYLATLRVEDVVLGMDLSHGGHLTHGSPVNISGKYYQFYSYGINPETGLIEMDEVRRIAREVNPQMIIAGASSYPRKIDFAAFSEIAREVDAYLMVDMAHIAGLIAAGLHPSPVPHAEFITSTTHKTLRGPRGGLILCKKEYAKDIDRAVFPGLQGGPLMHVIAAKAVGFEEALQSEFVEYQHQVVKNAKALASALQNFGFTLISGGTDNHLLLIDLRSKNITGKDAEELLEQVGITVNKNSIPFDPKGPIVTSGLRLGTPAVTSQGFKEEDMETIAYLINQAIELQNDAAQLEHIKREVARLCKKSVI